MRRCCAGAMRSAFNPFSTGDRQIIYWKLRQVTASIVENGPIGVFSGFANAAGQLYAVNAEESENAARVHRAHALVTQLDESTCD
jgi:hypothetical protein